MNEINNMDNRSQKSTGPLGSMVWIWQFGYILKGMIIESHEQEQTDRKTEKKRERKIYHLLVTSSNEIYLSGPFIYAYYLHGTFIRRSYLRLVYNLEYIESKSHFSKCELIKIYANILVDAV